MKKLLFSIMLAAIGATSAHAHDMGTGGIGHNVIGEQVLQADNIRSRNLTDAAEMKAVPQQIIQFEDEAVKALCVQNWDTDGDGELSEAEAAAVTDLGRVFSHNYEITTFDELRYFTGLTAICNHAFNNCGLLTSVIIPNTVTSIGEQAFIGCKLTEINIPSSVTYIGVYAFAYIKTVTSINIPKTVTAIDSDAFGACSSLTSITVESDNPYYDSRDNCNAIIETASNTLICGCMNTVIPNTVTIIDSFAFRDCTGLTSLTIPNSVKTVKGYAFTGCSGLTEVSFGNSVERISYDSFQYCSSLSSVTIPKSVTDIGYGVFRGCTSLANITVESGNPVYDSRDNCNAIIETASNTMISGCMNSVIPNTVTSIFHHTFSECSTLTSIEIPNSVTSIGANAFYSCSGLTSINIPNSVTTIGNNAFDYCSKLNDVYCYIEDLSTLSMGVSVFHRSSLYNYNTRTLHVPEGTAAAYQADNKWGSFFGTIVEMVHSGDVNGDNDVSIQDITALIDYLLGAGSTSFNSYHADVNGDGVITITDVTALIDQLLSGN